MVILSALRNIQTSVLSNRYRWCLLSIRSSHCVTVMCERNKFYLRQGEGDDFHVTFLLKDETIGIERQCNLCRKRTENLGTFVNRLTNKIDGLIEKKFKKKKKQNDETIIPKANVSFCLNGSVLSHDFVCDNFFNNSWQGELFLEVLNLKYDVAIDVPWIQSLSLSDSVMAGFQIYPYKLEGYNINKADCGFEWFKSKDKGEKVFNNKWVKCGDGFFYETKIEDIGHILKLICTPRKEGKTGPMFEVQMSEPVQPGPGPCPFENRHHFTAERCKSDELRIISYNILADLYAEIDEEKNFLSGYCPKFALNLGYRKQLLLKEILGYNADLLCLQEVDSKVFQHDLVPILEQQSLLGEYSEKGGATREGTAIFYNSLKLKMLKSNQIVLGDELDRNPIFSSLWDKIKENEPFCTRFKTRSTAVQCVVLEVLQKPEDILIVGNTHLFFHPDSDHIRLFQMLCTFLYLENQIKQIKQQFPNKHVSLLICGDFNSVPECGIYQLMTTGVVNSDCVDWKSNVSEAVTGVEFSHSLSMDSACGTPLFTNFTEGFKDCLDYIFYQKDRLEVRQVVPFPSVEELSCNIALPSIVFPSDHIALVADLGWKDLL